MAGEYTFSTGDPTENRMPRIVREAPAFSPLPGSSILERIFSNLAVCLSAPPAQLPKWAWAHAPMFRSAYFQRSFPWRSLLASSLFHVGMISWLVALSSLVVSLPQVPSEALIRPDQQVIWYTKADLLPPISPLPEPPKPVPIRNERPLVSPRVAFRAAQTIVSRPPNPDNRRQTIIQPEAPKARILTNVSIPNIVAWNPRPAVPPPPTPSAFQREAAQISTPQLPLPKVSVAPPPLPKPPELTPALGKISLPAVAVADIPKPPAPEVKQPPPTPPALQPEANTSDLPELIALGVAPSPPSEFEIRVPAGQRAGGFALSPEGEQDPSVESPKEAILDLPSPELPNNNLADLRVPHLSISGGMSPDLPAPPTVRVPTPATAAPAPSPLRSSSPNEVANLLAKATRPTILPDRPRSQPTDPRFFGDRRVYTVYINMPNLSSGSGSWILRFAEPEGDSQEPAEGEEITSPVAVRKVDPPYEASAIRDKVQGTVTLRAQILRDGTVVNIQVVQSLDPRLDLSAVSALTRWEFQPAKKNGAPIDLEVLVQIPFRLPSF